MAEVKFIVMSLHYCRCHRAIGREVGVMMSSAGSRSGTTASRRRRSWIYHVVSLIAVLLVSVSDQSPTLLDQFAAGFHHQPSPGAVGPVLPDSLPLPPSVVEQADPCYDHEVDGGARRSVTSPYL